MTCNITTCNKKQHRKEKTDYAVNCNNKKSNSPFCLFQSLSPKSNPNFFHQPIEFPPGEQKLGWYATCYRGNAIRRNCAEFARYIVTHALTAGRPISKQQARGHALATSPVVNFSLFAEIVFDFFFVSA
jgi:hypothetical protein